MRLLLGLVLGGAIFIVGLTAVAGGADLMSRRGFSEEVGVAFGLGVLLMAVGIAIVILSFKAASRRKAARLAGRRAPPVDRGEVEGTLMGIGMAHLINSDDFGGGDDGGDYSD